MDSSVHRTEARFLLTKINPGVSHSTDNGGGGTQLFTGDVSLCVFMDISIYFSFIDLFYRLHNYDFLFLFSTKASCCELNLMGKKKMKSSNRHKKRTRYK